MQTYGQGKKKACAVFEQIVCYTVFVMSLKILLMIDHVTQDLCLHFKLSFVHPIHDFQYLMPLKLSEM